MVIRTSARPGYGATSGAVDPTPFTKVILTPSEDGTYHHEVAVPHGSRTAELFVSAFDALGNCVGELDDTQQTVQWALDIDAVRQWREQFPALRDMHKS